MIQLQLARKNENGIVFSVYGFNNSEEALKEIHDLIQNVKHRYLDIYTYVVGAEFAGQYLILHTDTQSISLYEKESDYFTPVSSMEDLPEHKRIADKYKTMLGV